jgi:hypothetical protein
MGIELSMTLVLPYPLAIRAPELNHAKTMVTILFIAIIFPLNPSRNLTNLVLHISILDNTFLCCSLKDNHFTKPSYIVIPLLLLFSEV